MSKIETGWCLAMSLVQIVAHSCVRSLFKDDFYSAWLSCSCGSMKYWHTGTGCRPHFSEFCLKKLLKTKSFPSHFTVTCYFLFVSYRKKIALLFVFFMWYKFKVLNQVKTVQTLRKGLFHAADKVFFLSWHKLESVDGFVSLTAIIKK